MVSVTYGWHENGHQVAFFSVSNDSIKRQDCPNSAWKRIQKYIPHRKRYSSMPAVKIGRLGISRDYKRRRCGSRILDYLKFWFTENNKTGCRFLIVDAYNKPDVLAFYQDNGFRFLGSKDENDDTRIMYFDLILFANAAAAIHAPAPSPEQSPAPAAPSN